MPPSLTPQTFVEKWSQSALKERSSSQEHFIDVCRMVGHQSPAELDPAGQFFTFEAGATKVSGGEGWADVWYKGRFAWEYKGKHADLDKAYQQLLQYHEALESPPLLIVSDIDTIVIHTKFLNSVKRVYRLTFEDLLVPERLAILRAAFFNPEELRAPVTTVDVTKEAAVHFARLADVLRKDVEDPARIAHFLIQLLFCLFSEDVGLLPDGLFTRMVQQTRTRPDAFNQQLRLLFSQMSSGGWFGTEEIVQFNGHLFTGDAILELDVDGLAVLSEVTTLNWSSIEPSIFGTLFERSLDPSKRAQLGAHYTSREDILLIVEPVLMAPLRREWDEVKNKALSIASKLENSKGSQRTKVKNELEKLHLGFAGKISKVQVLDPACGSGNFLYVALRQLLDLEKEVINLAGDLGLGRFFPSVHPAQLHGIEINEYAHQLAQATIWIGYIQWMNENGFGFSVPVLKTLDNILLMDAILEFDEVGNPIEPEWPSSDVIIGNPPFLGGKLLRTELNDSYVDALFSLYENRVVKESDFVCYWFEKSRAYIQTGQVKRVGLLATNSIRGGANRKVLNRIKETGEIFWAQSDRDWILEGAAVNVSMIGFDNGSYPYRELDFQEVAIINPDLTAGVDLTKAKKIPENYNIAFMGVTPLGLGQSRLPKTGLPGF